MPHARYPTGKRVVQPIQRNQTHHILGQWIRTFTIPNQSSEAKAWQEFDENGRMKPSAWYARIVDVTEELFKVTLLLKGYTGYLAYRHSASKESHQPLPARINQEKSGIWNHR